MADALQQPIAEDADEEAYRERWRWAIRRDRLRWSTGEPCHKCGEWVGHFGGSTTRDPCSLIPLNVPLEELRPNCLAVRRGWIGDAIRAACKA
jgi:hypothetical protein